MHRLNLNDKYNSNLIKIILLGFDNQIEPHMKAQTTCK